jgi:hypothetical protein
LKIKTMCSLVYILRFHLCFAGSSFISHHISLVETEHEPRTCVRACADRIVADWWDMPISLSLNTRSRHREDWDSVTCKHQVTAYLAPSHPPFTVHPTVHNKLTKSEPNTWLFPRAGSIDDRHQKQICRCSPSQPHCSRRETPPQPWEFENCRVES